MPDDTQMAALMPLLRSPDPAQREQAIELALVAGPPLLHNLIDAAGFYFPLQARLRLRSGYSGGQRHLALSLPYNLPDLSGLSTQAGLESLTVNIDPGTPQQVMLPAMPMLRRLSVWGWHGPERQVTLQDAPVLTHVQIRNAALEGLSFSTLQAVTLQSCPAAFLAALLAEAPLTSLYAAHTPLSLPQSFSPSCALRRLALVGCRLDRVPDDVLRQPGLITLNLANNLIRAIPTRIDQLRSLERLVLSSNRIADVPDTIGALEGLRCLRLSANPLIALPQSIGALRALKELRLAHTRIRVLPEALGALENLQLLDLRHTGVTRVVLPGLPRLSSLDLRGAPVEVFPPPGTLPGLKQVFVKPAQREAALLWQQTRPGLTVQVSRW